MGLYDRDYMKHSEREALDWRPASADEPGALRTLLKCGLLFVGATLAVFALGWLASGGSQGLDGSAADRGVSWLPVGMIAMLATLALGADDPGGLRRALALLAGLTAVFAFYAWVMSRMGFDVFGSMLEHETGEGGGLPVYEALVYATPWWLLLVTTVIGALALSGDAELEGFRTLGTATLIVTVPYLVAKVLTQEMGVNLFH